ncbi:hypothetical protein [Celeribacter baekdonensis]|uniref:hypothetical protein n=1 Tax=Celeribacter baekdonensis TaxID=875171 RepID=UPI003A932531
MLSSTRVTHSSPFSVLRPVAVHSGALFLAMAVTWLVISPLQKLILPQIGMLGGGAILIYLPFGIKIISAFFEGWRSILYLLPGAILASVLFIDLPWGSSRTYISLCISYGTAPFIFSAIDWASRCGHHVPPSPELSWRKLIAVGFLSSIMISLLIHIFYVPHDTASFDLRLNAIKFALGDMLGLIAVLALLPPVLNFVLHRANPN